MIGKVPPGVLAEHVLSRTGAADGAVETGPAYGEDAAAISLGDGHHLVVSSDPISLAADRVGTLAVHVACNDVAACGADPRWLTAVIVIPGDRPDLLDRITRQLDSAATSIGVSIVGGHSEYSGELSRPFLSMTCLGIADRFIRTGGATPGDVLLLAGAAGIEGTAIIATDFRDRFKDVPDDVLERAASYYDDVSVIDAAAAIREHATAMHDPTEGGLLAGLLEVANASGVGIEISRADVPVRPETDQLCRAIGVDPLRIFGSGGLVSTVHPEDVDAALSALSDRGIRAATIGRVVDGDPGVMVDGERLPGEIRDDLYELWT